MPARKLRAEALAEFLSGWEAEHGVLTAAEIARGAGARPGGRRYCRVSALILDAGALVAVDRDDRGMIARLLASQQHGLELRTNAMVVAQVWRDQHGRQANLARLLRAVDVRAVSQRDGREAGVLQAAAGTADATDATVVLLAAPGDRILASDPSDLTVLAAAAKNRAVIVGC